MNGIPVTRPLRTLLDLAAVAPRDVVEEALDDALRRRLVTLVTLRRRLAVKARGRPGTTTLRSLVAARTTPAVPQSVFETRLHRVLKQAHLPPPVLQHRITRNGRLIAIVDFAYPEVRLAIEADSHRWHSGRTHWDHDRSRRNELTLIGWRVIHVTWSDVTRRPGFVTESIRRGLAGKRTTDAPTETQKR